MTRGLPARRRKRLAIGAALLLTAATLSTVSVAAPASAAVAFTRTAVNQASGNCMDDPYSSTSSGTQLIQYSCNSGSNQSWAFTPVAGTTASYTVTSFAGLCVGVAGSSTADNAAVQQLTCDGATSQRITLQPVTVSGATNTLTVAGTAVSLQLSASDSASGQTLRFSATGLPAGLSISTGGLVSGTPSTAGTSTVVVTATDTTGAAGSASFGWVVTSSGGGSTTYLGIPAVAPNACDNSSLPNVYGTNFPVPADPLGQGFANETALGWDGNYWPVLQYLSGSFFARGVPTTYNNNGTNICGAMYSFSIYHYNGNRAATEAQYSDTAYTNLLNHTNTVVANNESAHGFSYLPCTVNQANTSNRCNTYNDANWAVWVGQNQWSTMLMGGTLNGVIGDPAQSDAMYAMGFARLASHSLPYPTFGAFTGYSTAYNTAYVSNGLYGSNYRDLPITSYAWQIATTTGGPNAWWEANGSGSSSSNPWIGNHAGPEFGAIPYAWPISAQQEGLLQSVVAEGLSATGSGPYTYTRPLYIGRGIPNTWIASGQTISVSNLTDSYSVGSGSRSTYGVSISVTKPSTRVVTVNLSGSLPGGAVSIQLPIFLSVSVNSVGGGTYNASTHTVTANSGATSIAITLAS